MKVIKESINESKEILYVIKDRNGNILSRPNPDDSELWDRVESMEARGKRGLKVVVYTNESLITEAPDGKLGKQIAKKVKAGMDFDDAVDEVANSHDMNKEDMKWAIHMAKEILGDDTETAFNSKWKNELDKDIALTLRSAINDENYQTLSQSLKDAWTAIHEMMPDDFDEDELEEKISDIDFLDLEPNDKIDVSQEDIEDNFNYELNDLYDFCDAMNIWIPLR